MSCSLQSTLCFRFYSRWWCVRRCSRCCSRGCGSFRIAGLLLGSLLLSRFVGIYGRVDQLLKFYRIFQLDCFIGKQSCECSYPDSFISNNLLTLAWLVSNFIWTAYFFQKGSSVPKILLLQKIPLTLYFEWNWKLTRKQLNFKWDICRENFICLQYKSQTVNWMKSIFSFCKYWVLQILIHLRDTLTCNSFLKSIQINERFLTLSVGSVMLCSLSKMFSWKFRPVTKFTPLGISSTVCLNWATTSPESKLNVWKKT